ncbi:ATP-binding cassette domain-containing protein [Erysipelothrix sp. HDW6C]|uniref:ATP-binding cassette domain-containing protein n=1 Tax=Erysipelothrix sp. HDW6C TaxID=2714930 RepID=UPI00140B23E3|nr:ATP-binding cassette domain-containing protein [Erysipelothrix sp. HDW6C]QIK68822.1 ATP-binding cassette domain-containing protein [Erysipelothrix sp. HDW6C]
MTILNLEGVSYKYDGTQNNVIDNINVQFENGKIYGIVGKSGAGKSTLLSLLSGLDIASNGVIAYEGSNLATMDRDDYRAKSIGVVFQQFNLLTNATAIENIVLSMEIGKSDVKDKKAFALNLLEMVGIDERTAKRKVLKLSGGEQQRVGVARAIANNPDLVIADEPTANLDSETAEDLMAIFTRLAHEENKCVIIVSHSKMISDYSDEVWRLKKGILTFEK